MKRGAKKYQDNYSTSRYIPAKTILPLLFGLVFASCNPTKKLLPGQYLLNNVEVINAGQTNIPNEDLEAFYRQKPNRKLLRKFHFFVWWYNRFDNEKIRKNKVARNQKYDRKNAEKVKRFEKKNIRRTSKGKKPRIPKLKNKESATFLEGMRDIGEPAVVLDSLLTEQTRFQLSRYLFSKGYFNNSVSDSVSVKRKKKKASVFYILRPGKAYTISGIRYELEDSLLGTYVMRDAKNSLLYEGMQYDAQKLQLERERITDVARNNGYFNFENAYIEYDVDTAFAGNQVSLVLRINKFSKPYNSVEDSLVQVNHTRYTINKVYIITEPVIGNIREAHFSDTLRSKKGKFIFLMNRPLAYKEYLITNNIDVYEGQVFNKDSAQHTYKQLMGLGVFKNVIPQFVNSPGYSDRLDYYLICIPFIKQSLTAETEGTNTSGNLGIDGSLVYQNRNFFRAGELVELKLQGSIAAQSQLRVQEETSSNIQQIPRTFNTIQFGPELTFSVPRAFFPFSLLPFRKDMSPRTYVKTSLNYQARPEFNRVITAIDYGFNFKTNNNTVRHDIVPMEVYFVRANLTNSFTETLNQLNDAFLVNSFQDHVTTLSRYTLNYFSKENKNTSRKTVHYVRWSVQSSGSILRWLFNARGREKDSLGRYQIFGIPFAHFLRTDVDYRLYIPVRKRSRIVYRVAGGVGKPLINLNVLPYEQSFFSGGPNSVRAWRARTLGPGGYDPRVSNARFDKIGDVLLEGNFEYRFHVIKSFNGAFFIDAGNIWRLEADDNKPRGELNINTFADQIAIGSGFGIRWDLEFFVLRLDLAVPLKDPKYEPGDRWMFDKTPWRYAVANFGIGYPF